MSHANESDWFAVFWCILIRRDMIVRTVVGLCVMTLLNAHNVDEEILSFDTELSPELNLTLIGSEFIKYPPYNEKFLQVIVLSRSVLWLC